MSRVSVSDSPPTRKVKLGQLVEFRSRQVYKALDELAVSLKQHGQIEPLIVRLSSKTAGKKEVFEIAAGTRRRRAAVIAGLETLECVVRDLSDQQMVEISVAENRDREDIHPLEEADAFVDLHDTYGVAIAEMGARFGKSDDYVWGRMKIARMHQDLRVAFLAGRFGVKGALVLAGIADTMQARVWGELSKLPDANLSAAKIAGFIRDRFLMRLAVAPFPTAKDDLVDGAGSCLKCPKRTGTQASLFPDDITSEDRCTDADCFTSKKQAFADALVERATEKNLRVLEKAEAKEVFKFGESLETLNPDCSFVAVDGKVRLGEEGITYRALLEKCPPPIIVAINPGGAGLELYEKSAVAKAMRAAKVPFVKEWESVCLPKSLGSGDASKASGEKSDKSETKLDRRAAELAITAIRTEFAEDLTVKKRMQIVAMGAVRNTWSQVQKAYIKLHGLDDGQTGGDANARILAMFEDHIGKLSAGECIGLVIELALLREVLGSSGAPDVESETFKRALVVLGFKWSNFQKAAKREREQGKKASPRGKASSGASSKLTSKKGAKRGSKAELEEEQASGLGGSCSVCNCTRGEPCNRDGKTCSRGVGEERCSMCEAIIDCAIGVCEEKKHSFKFEEVFVQVHLQELVADTDGDRDVVRSCLDQMIEAELIVKLDDDRYQNVPGGRVQ